MRMLNIEDALCKLCRVWSRHRNAWIPGSEEHCSRCGGSGFDFSQCGCCLPGDECEDDLPPAIMRYETAQMAQELVDFGLASDVEEAQAKLEDLGAG